ncbi:MAG: hypothetical protein ACXVCP_10495 [Bdellovibrio sp.]
MLIFLTSGFHFWTSISQALPSAHFNQILPLMPPDSRFVEVTDEMKEGFLIDQLVANIFSTSAGKSFCGAVVDNYDEFKRSFFLHDDSAREAFAHCEGFFAKKQRNRIFPKKYFIITTDSTDFAFDGWTSALNETLLVLSKKDYSTDRLTRTLAHELAIILDKKEQIGFMGAIDFPQLGIETNIDSCTAIPILRNAEVKTTLSAFRAFDMEKKICTELGISLPTGFAEWNTLSCLEKIQFIAPYTQRLSSAVVNENLFNDILDRPHCTGKTVPVSNVFEKMKALDHLYFTFANGSTINICEYMSKGWPFLPGASFRGGPGPRIGGGGWKSLLRNDNHLIEKSLQKSGNKLTITPLKTPLTTNDDNSVPSAGVSSRSSP